MSNIIATVSGIDGIFYVKSPDGSLHELSNGDTIHKGDIVLGGDTNSASDSIILLMQDGTDIVLNANDKQLFDNSLASNEFSIDETITQNETIKDAINQTDIFSEADKVIISDDIETASGDEAQSTTSSNSSFAQEFEKISDDNIAVAAQLRDVNSKTILSSDTQNIENENTTAAQTAVTQANTAAQTAIDAAVASETITDNAVATQSINVTNLTEALESVTTIAQDAATQAQTSATLANENPTPENIAAAETAAIAAQDAATAVTNAVTTLSGALVNLQAVADAANESVDTTAAQTAVTQANTAAQTAIDAAVASETITEALHDEEDDEEHDEDDNHVLLISGDENIDLSALDKDADDIETIKLGEGEQHITNISLEDVIELTENENILRIEGDEDDTISLNVNEDEWQLGDFKTDSETGVTYQEVTGTVEDQTVTLEINTDIQIDQN
ncbi:hypothetical protein [Sulfurimonas sp.]